MSAFFFIDCCSYNMPFVHRLNKNRGDNWPGGDYVDCCSYLGVKKTREARTQCWPWKQSGRNGIMRDIKIKSHETW